jgi:hypothetical protein
VITIAGFGDRNQPEWLITFTGIRNSPVGSATAAPSDVFYSTKSYI